MDEHHVCTNANGVIIPSLRANAPRTTKKTSPSDGPVYEWGGSAPEGGGAQRVEHGCTMRGMDSVTWCGVLQGLGISFTV